MKQKGIRESFSDFEYQLAGVVPRIRGSRSTVLEVQGRGRAASQQSELQPQFKRPLRASCGTVDFSRFSGLIPSVLFHGAG